MRSMHLSSFLSPITYGGPNSEHPKILWNVEPLLSNGREINKYTIAVTKKNGSANKHVSKATIMGSGAFYTVHVKRSLESVSYSRVAVTEAENSSNPRGSGTFAAGSRYQKTGEDTAGGEGLSVCSSEL
jgi:hypothetical protein